MDKLQPEVYKEIKLLKSKNKMLTTYNKNEKKWQNLTILDQKCRASSHREITKFNILYQNYRAIDKIFFDTYELFLKNQEPHISMERRGGGECKNAFFNSFKLGLSDLNLTFSFIKNKRKNLIFCCQQFCSFKTF